MDTDVDQDMAVGQDIANKNDLLKLFDDGAYLYK